MSNASIIAKLQEEILGYGKNEISSSHFEKSFVRQISALDAVPYPTIQEMRQFQAQIAKGGYAEAEGCQFDRRHVARAILAWLDKRK